MVPTRMAVHATRRGRRAARLANNAGRSIVGVVARRAPSPSNPLQTLAVVRVSRRDARRVVTMVVIELADVPPPGVSDHWLAWAAVAYGTRR
jgi:hypothetical protein